MLIGISSFIELWIKGIGYEWWRHQMKKKVIKWLFRILLISHRSLYSTDTIRLTLWRLTSHITIYTYTLFFCTLIYGYLLLFVCCYIMRCFLSTHKHVLIIVLHHSLWEDDNSSNKKVNRYVGRQDILQFIACQFYLRKIDGNR